MGQIFYSNLIKKRRTKKKIKVTILHSRQKSFIFYNNMLSFAPIFDTNFQRDRRLNSKLKISINAKMFCSIRGWLIAKKQMNKLSPYGPKGLDRLRFVYKNCNFLASMGSKIKPITYTCQAQPRL